MRNWTFITALIAGLVGACTESRPAPPEAPPPAPSEAPASAPASRPASAPARAEATTSEADRVAAAIARAAGDPYAAELVRFDFVVYDGGEERFRRRHAWRPQAEVDVVTVGEAVTRVEDLGEPPSGPAAEGDAAAAYAAWVNDVFWLLAPAKVMDPGVRRSLDDQGRLVVRFEGVGLTPGDRYAYTFDPDTHRVTRWDYELQSGRKGSFRWLDYEVHGPVTVSTRRPSADGQRVIALENVVVE